MKNKCNILVHSGLKRRASIPKTISLDVHNRIAPNANFLKEKKGDTGTSLYGEKNKVDAIVSSR